MKKHANQFETRLGLLNDRFKIYLGYAIQSANTVSGLIVAYYWTALTISINPTI